MLGRLCRKGLGSGVDVSTVERQQWLKNPLMKVGIMLCAIYDETAREDRHRHGSQSASDTSGSCHDDNGTNQEPARDVALEVCAAGLCWPLMELIIG